MTPLKGMPAACRRGLRQQIVILREEHSPERRGPVQQRRIVNVTEPILEGRQHIDVPQPQPGRDRPWHVLIHIQRERHQCPPRARRRARRGAVGV
jgi:hypothetical protein